MMNSYDVIDGIKCYAPDLAQHNNNYPQESFEQLFSIENKHFWFQARNKCIGYLISKYIGNTKQKKFLEIGCGTGVVLQYLQQKTDFDLCGAEIHLTGLQYARKRMPHVEFLQLDATSMPFSESYDAIGAFDVLEHIDADELVIKNVYKALSSNGKFFISVPQYQWMWSKADDEAFHKRRYTKKEIKYKLANNDFEILYCGSYVFTLFPLMLASRFLNRFKKSNNSSTELSIHPLLNRLFSWLTALDVALIRSGIVLPFGGSILCVAVKKK